MSDYSFPKCQDDVKSCLVYTIAAEFIYRLDEFLEYEHSDAGGDSLPVDTVAVVKHCSLAAVEMLCALVHPWNGGTTEPFEPASMYFPAASPMAAEMIRETAKVLNSRLPATVAAHVARGRFPSKWQLMFTLGTEFFLCLGAMTETVLASAKSTVDVFDVDMLRGCIDAAMGMVYELRSVVWPEEHEVPARAMLGIQDHVFSCRLEDAGPEAMSLVQEVYEFLTRHVRGEG